MTPDSAKKKRRTIGILGGMGPQAGFDLATKITSMTPASKDQDHFNIIVLSMPSEIDDRTAFLSGKSTNNPTGQLQKQIASLYKMNTDVVVIACNTAHAAPILEPLQNFVARECGGLTFLNLIDETLVYVRETLPDARRIGVLGTRATFDLGLYDSAIEKAGLVSVVPEDEIRETCIFPAIYDPVHGIKAMSNPVSDTSRELVEQAVVHLARRGADAVLLGCTELPLALAGVNEFGIRRSMSVDGRRIQLIDPAVAMTCALIKFCSN